MIKKLKEHDIIDPKTNKVIGKIGCDLREIIDKLNELVDVVNEIMTWRFETDEDSDWYDDPKCRERPADPYAEQRKWEGKLCWFWDENPEDKIVDVLSCIDISDKYPYVMCDRQVHYKYCEPVKPDSELIYHGEQQ